MAGIGIICKGFLLTTNCSVHNRRTFSDMFAKRDPHQGLITVCNHDSVVDDPVIWEAALRTGQLFNPDKMRWTIGASEICFKTRAHSLFFSIGRVISVTRGEGVYQKGMDQAIQCLNGGSWVNIFPEGRVNYDDNLLPRFKWGVGRLAYEPEITPIILPVYHKGLSEIQPSGKALPRVGKSLDILIGEPLYVAEYVKKAKEDGIEVYTVYKTITDLVEVELEKLETQYYNSIKINY
eukprot:TRINITY_DN2992_c0_g1_i2.p1 TRINITY_DN2992_c0_g1~~TRINITY_DN2992_c0_g1_i2.p1  ORF type:complete len:236 (-),score=34.82 TRINITY_DN2992_c0_g1_i2:232-939(-)